MPAKPTRRPNTRQGIVGFQMPPEDVDPAVDRAFGAATAAIQRLEAGLRTRTLVVWDLVVGTNRVPHNLGRRPRHCHITPTVASAAFAYALTSADDKIATIDVVGLDQTGAGIAFE